MKLSELGYGNILDGFDAQPIEGYALFMDGQHFKIPYPELNGIPVTGRGFRYGKFISSLRHCLRHLPSVSLIEGSVIELSENSDGSVSGVRYLSKEQAGVREIHAPLTVICDGGFSKFRHRLNHSGRTVKGFMVGLLLKNCHLPYPRHGHVFLGGASPFLSYPVSSAETRILIDFPGEHPPRNDESLRHYLRETVYPQLPAQMQTAFIHAISENKFKAMPNMMVASKPVRKAGVVLLGDSLNMRHPLTGGGMTVALTDVQLLGDLLAKAGSLKNKNEINQAVEEFYRKRHSVNATINILADALYGVMSHPDLKKTCFDYLKRGKSYVKAPISILSAVSRDRNLLIRKFFAVALFGAGHLLKPIPSPSGIRQAYHLIRNAVHIISPLLLNENPSRGTQAWVRMGKWVFPDGNANHMPVRNEIELTR